MATSRLSVEEVLGLLDEDELDWSNSDVDYDDDDCFPVNLDDKSSLQSSLDPLDRAQGLLGGEMNNC